MTEDEEGFLYPIVDVSICIDCHLCEKVCPVQNQFNINEPKFVYAAVNHNKDVLKNSSSGGIFSLLAKKIIDNGGVVFGAAFNKEWEVFHTYTDTNNEIEQFRGSKYSQSRIGDSYKQAERFLSEGRTVLFSGTPCQISGLKHYLMKPYDNLYCIGIICHGVPSPGVWRNYLNSLLQSLIISDSDNDSANRTSNKLMIINNINFRDKANGWRDYNFVISGRSAKCEDKSNLGENNTLFREHAKGNLYMRGFLNNLYLRPSCHNCPARHGKSNSDIMLGDFWGVQRRYPSFYNADGVSLVLVYTNRGNSLINSVDCTKMQITYDDALDCNKNIEINEKTPKNRKNFFLSYKKNGIRAIDKYCRQLEPNLIEVFMSKIKFKLKQYLKI